MGMYTELYECIIKLGDLKFPYELEIEEGYLELNEREVEGIVAHMYNLAESGKLFTTAGWAQESKRQADGSILINGNHLRHFHSSARALDLLFTWYNDKNMGAADIPDTIIFN